MLDMGPVLMSYVSTSALITVAIGLLWRQNRRRYAGLFLWMIGGTVQVAGLSLILVHSLGTGTVALTLGRLLVSGGLFITYLGLKRFVGKSGGWAGDIVLLATYGGLLLYFTYLRPNLSAQVVIFSVAILLLAAQCGDLMLRRTDPSLRPATRYAGYAFLVFACAALARVVFTLLNPLPSGGEIFQAPSGHVLAVAGMYLASILVVLALVQTVARRLQEDVQAEEEERVRAQEALHAHSANLEREVAQRTESLRQELAQRRAAEQALRASEERYRRLFTETINGFALHEILCDEAGSAVDYVTLEVNAAYEAMLSAPRAAVVGRKASEILPPGELAQWLGVFGPVALTGSSAHYELYSPLNCKRFEGTAYCPEKGKFAVTFADITERERAKAVLQAGERRFRSLFENSDDAILLTVPDGRILAANPAACRIFGRSEAEICELGRGGLVDLADPRLPVAIEERNRTGRFRGELTYVRRDGTRFPGEVATVLFEDEDGQVRTSMVIRDVSERVRVEEQLREALEEKTALLREAHHRVKNSLQTMIALLQLRREEIGDPQARRLLSQLAEQARTMALVYEQLHQTSSIAQVKMQPYLEMLASNVLQAYGTGREVALCVDAGDIVLDTQWAMPCGLIVNELVTNALKHAFPPHLARPPAVSVALSRGPAGWVLRVADNGVGMPPAGEHPKGAALGLDLVNLWATHQMGGTLQAEAGQGVACTITFRGDDERG